MNRSYTYTFIIPIIISFCVTVLCSDTDKCYLNSKTKNEGEEKFLNRISPYFGQTFRTQKDGFSYVVAICTDTSKSHPNVSVTKSKVKDETIILGRRNESYITGGDTWVMLRYESKIKPNETDSQCLTHYSVSIFIVCDPKKHDEPPSITFVKEDGSDYEFLLPSMSICEHEEEVSGGTIFFIILSVAFFMYFIVGIIYRRLVHDAKGCQQLPHFTFWRQIGGLFSDGCNYVCRCDPEERWDASNVTVIDTDEALLRP